MIRAAAKSGESRLIDLGYCHDWTDIQQLALAHKIEPYNVLVDSGNETEEVYQTAIKMGKWVQIGNRKIWASWTCFKGQHYSNFLHKDGVRRPFIETTRDGGLHSDPVYRGKKARLINWSTHPFRTILNHLKDGKGIRWVSNIQDEKKRELYQRHLSCEQLEDVRNTKTGLMEMRYRPQHNDNHWYDAELQVLVAMYCKGLLGNYADTQLEEPREESKIVSV